MIFNVSRECKGVYEADNAGKIAKEELGEVAGGKNICYFSGQGRDVCRLYWGY